MCDNDLRPYRKCGVTTNPSYLLLALCEPTGGILQKIINRADCSYFHLKLQLSLFIAVVYAVNLWQTKNAFLRACSLVINLS